MKANRKQTAVKLTTGKIGSRVMVRVVILQFKLQYSTINLHSYPNITMKANPGVSIKFEVGSWLEKNNRLYEQGAVWPLNLGGSGGMLP